MSTRRFDIEIMILIPPEMFDRVAIVKMTIRLSKASKQADYSTTGVLQVAGRQRVQNFGAQP
ncbi:hypothetical protein AN958_09156 [Leucoagaricus sp. SymC.cos]|nr:hypothetical protein AN958_09156 [Leucoagaricus sp. SymC.cos]